MSDYRFMDSAALLQEQHLINEEFEKIKAMGLSLDMTRGKPGFDQLDLSDGLLNRVGGEHGYIAMKGTDCRNYGGLDGLDELKELFGSVLGINWENVICGGNSSLNMMFDTITQGMVSGFGEGPWMNQGEIKFICPSPGYDRHFGICEYYGIKMIPVPYLSDGPDMDMVEELVRDPKVKGMWCVPKYSNPTGITYSDTVVRRIAALKPAASDFRVMWDNAYVIHDLYDEGEPLLGIYEECKKNGNEDLVIMFTSTSKISFPGAGIAVEAASDNNLRMIKARMTVQTIGPNKLNQLCHGRMFPNTEALLTHMKRHAEVLRPKFEACLETFASELSGRGVAEWTKPRGGYFISMQVLDGTAKRVGALCREAGLAITKPGATYPYGLDPDDSNIRIAPSYPSAEEMKKAAYVLSVAVKKAAVEKLIAEKK